MPFDLNTLWFILIAILFAGFFFLEGFEMVIMDKESQPCFFRECFLSQFVANLSIRRMLAM